MNAKETFLNNIIDGSELWKDKATRKQVKAKDSGAYRRMLAPFRNYQRHHVVGALVDMLTSLGEEATQEQWEQFYREECDKHGRKGLLTDIAWSLWHDIQFEVEPARVFSFVVNRVLDETFDGVATENLAKKLIGEIWDTEGYVVRHATRWEERDWSVDFLVSDSDGRIVKGYQVKPDTFFSPTVTRDRNPSLFEDRVSNCKKMFALANKIGEFESVEFVKKSELEDGIFAPFPISVFDREGNVV